MNVDARLVVYGGLAVVALVVIYKVLRTGKEIGAAVAETVQGAVETVTDAAVGFVDAVTPTNPDNVFARAANAVTRAVTGDPVSSGATLGTKIADAVQRDPEELFKQYANLRGQARRPGATDEDVRAFITYAQKTGQPFTVSGLPSFYG